MVLLAPTDQQQQYTRRKSDHQPMPDLNEFMTTDEAAKVLGFTVESVRNLVYKNKLESRKFGRAVLIDQLTFYLRADFPHDAWWEKASVTFSDGESASFSLQKTGAAQSFPVAPRQVEWIRLHDLKKADDPSPFPALTQIEVWGADLREAP